MLKLLLHTRYFFFVLLLFLCSKQIKAQLTYNELSVQYDSPWTFKKLQLIPIRFKSAGNGDTGHADIKMFDGNLISFSDALRQHKIVIKEVSSGGADVSMLMVKNKSKDNVMLMSGEMVTGGKQDRAFGKTIIIPGKNKNYVPVFCVEKGRWDDRAKSFRHGGTADMRVRKQIDVTQRQSKIWRQIDTVLTEKNKKNQTSAYMKAFEDANADDTSYLRYFINKMKNSDSSYAGFIAVTGNRIINAEIFAGTDLCLTAYIENIKSYVRSLTSTDGFPNKTHNELKIFTDKFLSDKTTQKKYLSVNGRLYYYNGNVIHLVAYDTP